MYGVIVWFHLLRMDESIHSGAKLVISESLDSIHFMLYIHFMRYAYECDKGSEVNVGT